MVRYFLFILLIFKSFGTAMQISTLDRNLNQVIVNFAKKMQKKGLHPCGLGGREDKGKIMDFKVVFQYARVLDIPASRQLIVEAVLLFLEEINADKAVRKYLPHYPFTPNDVIVTILPDCSSLSDEDCKSSIIVSSYLGRINYRINDGIVKPLHELHAEPFLQAQEILNSRKQL